MVEAGYYKWQGDNLILAILVQTGAAKNSIVGQHGKYLKIKITSQPIEGKANKQLIAFLAAHFCVAKNKVEIVRGSNTKYKTVVIVAPKKISEEIVF